MRRSGGFTLMEVLAALLLIGLVLPVALDGIGRCVDAGSAAKRRAEAATLAEAKLNEVLVTATPNLATGSGEFGVEWPGYKWDVQSVSTDFNLYEITVTVTWAERGGEKSLRLSTLMHDAAAAAEGSQVSAPVSAGGAQ
ncbi:MAG TPA: prepilin-type N-terminal cleavage/methylation domain-containing protein [Tepidisphaeraceae bacterium]|nr:prepilin-type N-terminal cleavage/methylation domain-containing protein [Tepidisphaeraceae bacterium]